MTRICIVQAINEGVISAMHWARPIPRRDRGRAKRSGPLYRGNDRSLLRSLGGSVLLAEHLVPTYPHRIGALAVAALLTGHHGFHRWRAGSAPWEHLIKAVLPRGQRPLLPSRCEYQIPGTPS
jgi:hypothetical protein